MRTTVRIGSSADQNSLGEVTATVDLSAATTVTVTRGNTQGTYDAGIQVINFNNRFTNIPTGTSGLNTNALHSMVFADLDEDGYMDMAKSSDTGGNARTLIIISRCWVR